MKTKITLLLALVLSSLFISAQTVMNIHQSNGTMLQLPLNTIDSITYTISNPGNLATLTTLPIGNITTSGATSGGNIANDGGSTITSRGICWGTSSNPTTADNYSVNGSGTGSFTSNLSGLTGETTYYVRGYAINSAGTSYGNELSFTATNPIQLATLSTTTVSSITETTSVSGGNITDDGGGTVTSRGVCWSTSSNPTPADNSSVNGSGTGSFASNLSGLTGGTTYYVRGYAINSVGTAYGNEVSFTTTTPIHLATLSTTTVSSITETTSVSGGNITNDGGDTVTSRGVCWSTSSNPTPADNSSVNGSGTGSFTSNLSGLTGGTTYYVRGYAINSLGTAYGNEVSFTTRSSSGVMYGDGVTDANGNTYQSVIIGTQEWMTENLRTTKYSDGTAIPNVTSASQWVNLSTGAWCNYNNSSSKDATYGKLYNWYAVNTSKLCPTGWHLPTDAEWTVLTDYLAADGHNGTQGTALKATSGWYSDNGTDDYGFLGLPGGLRNSNNGNFYNIGNDGYWWSSSQIYTYYAWSRNLDASNDNVYRSSYTKDYGFSVRCLRD
jgi:uncharacterized protein (TIGR02145 family)